MVERNMCNAATRGIVVLPGSRATPRAKGSRRNLGGPTSGHHWWSAMVSMVARIGKARSRSR